MAQLPSGCARGCLWCKFLHNYPGFMGHSPPSGRRFGTLPASLSLLSVPNFCLCAPFPPRAGWEQQLLLPGGSWNTKDQGCGDGSGVGERRELVTNSSLGGWHSLGEIMFFKLPQSWASLNKPEYPHSNTKGNEELQENSLSREKPAEGAARGCRIDPLFPKLAKNTLFIPLWWMKTLQTLSKLSKLSPG